MLVRIFLKGLTYWVIGCLCFLTACVSGSESDCIKLPVYFNTVEANDTLIHIIPDFRFLSQDNQIITSDSLKGFIHIADFFFTTCPGICKSLSSEMKNLQLRFENDADIKLISYTVDPENDSLSVLKDYAEMYHAISGKWYLLTADKDSMMFQHAIHGYKAPAFITPEGKEKVTHSPLFFLVDKELRVRGFYNILEDSAKQQLYDDIDMLKCEYRENSAK